MRIDGRMIAQNIREQLKLEIHELKEMGILPHLIVILIGDDPASLVYVDQKKKTADEIGVKLTVYNLPLLVSLFELKQLVLSLNSDPTVHGIILQRPIPLAISKDQADSMVIPDKDVDGFHPQTHFVPPISGAILKILQWVGNDTCNNPASPLKQNYCETFPAWLSKQKILVIGRGETAGKPIVDTLIKKGLTIHIAHSTTKYLDALIRTSNIVISCVGKPHIVRHQDVTSKTILIGVGLHHEKGKLVPDYDQEEVEKTAAYFTPVPGGVGPVNVACLFENLIQATRKNPPS